jgi:hypothetical protein
MSDATSTENEAVAGEGWYPDPKDVTAKPILIAYMLFAMGYLAYSLIAGSDAKQIIAAALPVLIGVLSWAVHRPRIESP